MAFGSFVMNKSLFTERTIDQNCVKGCATEAKRSVRREKKKR